VNDGCGLVLSENLIYLFNLFEICIHVLYILLARDLLQSVQALELRVVQVVQYQHVVAFLDQLDHSVGADVAEAASHKDLILR
jgi:hypothetical protein